MANIDLLPEFFDPLLSYLSDVLPGPAYSLLISFLSHVLAIISALFSLWSSLLSTSPAQWDTQMVLPPLIALLSAYLALYSLYRTTTFMLRTSLWFIKWGTILASLAAMSAWFMGGGNAVANGGIVSNLGVFVLDMINGEKSSRRTHPKKPRPKPWESFEAHSSWQYQEAHTGEKDSQQVIEELISAAGVKIKETNWWSVVQSIVDRNAANEGEDDRRAGRSKGSTSR
ncbi:hypothetical protein D9758_002079 [Tetrapyrgos nigripes]|uniref:Uncharacterized protein n=1 Tax=Tetrapyrgos nigripes TaxID=182062 RepID=A0A8H5GT15_9AGAR|nr:hypothetical protein D9758_002079 [Tetrapyrgos nigripes]